MKLIIQKTTGGPETLILGEAEIPKLRTGEVLVKVKAAGINRPDIFQREGVYPPPPDASPTLGLEVAGVIVDRDASVTKWEIGQEVCALTNSGGYAEFVTVPAGQCLPIPKGYSFVEAAALPETFFTVWHNVVQRGQLKAGENFLVHGGASGIGTAAIQIARFLGAQVFATVGSTEKKRVCEQLGARVVNYRDEDFVRSLKAATDNHGMDVILDMVGGDYVEKNILLAARDARIVSIASLRGGRCEIDMNRVMMKRLILTGSTLRAQSDTMKSMIAQELEQAVWPHFTSIRSELNEQSLRPIIDSVYPLEQVQEAHRRMESNQHIGKIVLDVS